MTNKQRKTMIERWVTQMNPKAILRAADARCGARYAVCVVEKPGDLGTKCTDYLPLEQLERMRDNGFCFSFRIFRTTKRTNQKS